MRRLTSKTSQGGSLSGLPRRPIAALALLGALLLVAGIALAAQRAPQPPTPPAPPAPTITAQPTDPSAVKSASFSYSDSQPGVSFECQLDGGSYVSCPGGTKTYSNLSDEKHTFRVRAAAGTSKTSAGSTVSWTVDTVPPGVALVDPPNGALLGAAAWGHGCPRGAGLCGTAKDSASGVGAVSVSISDGAGHWWGGSAFNRSSETFQSAQLSNQGARSVSWSYALGLPADGGYTVHVLAGDGAGNQSATQSSTFTVDTKAPPAPAIGSGPAATTTSKSASFTFSDQETGVTFECSRDQVPFKRCTSPLVYPSNSIRAHQFQVRAKDGAGNLSAATTYNWTVVKQAKETSGKPFTVTGNAAGGLAPGVSQPLLVTIHNPNTVPITVTALVAEVRAATSTPSCDGPTNIAITQSDISPTNPVSVPAGGQLTLPSGTAHAPQALMRDLSTNQDACKSATFTFNYSGSAHS